MYSKMKETLIKEMELINKATKSKTFKTDIDSLRAIENIENEMLSVYDQIYDKLDKEKRDDFFTARMFYLGIYLGLSIKKESIQRCLGNNNLID